MIHIYEKGTNDRVLVLLHGTGGNERDLINVGKFIDGRANILSIRGNVSENGMNRFFKRLGHGVYDEKDLQERGEELAKFILDASKEYHFDMKNVVLVGFSNGANIAINLLLEHHDLFNKGVLLSPMYPIQVDEKDLKDTHVFISTGKNDPICTNADSQYVVDTFTDRNARVEHIWCNGHEVNVEILDNARKFVNSIM